MKPSVSRFVSVWLMKSWNAAASTSSEPIASASARSTSALKITRPGVVSTSSPSQRYSIGCLEVDLLRGLERELDLLLGAEPLQAAACRVFATSAVVIAVRSCSA